MSVLTRFHVKNERNFMHMGETCLDVVYIQLPRAVLRLATEHKGTHGLLVPVLPFSS